MVGAPDAPMLGVMDYGVWWEHPMPRCSGLMRWSGVDAVRTCWERRDLIERLVDGLMNAKSRAEHFALMRPSD